MNFLADESVDKIIVTRLRRDGHDLTYIAEIAGGISDVEVLSRAFREKRILLTGDKDFGELVYRRKWSNVGVVLLRLEGMRPSGKADLVSSVVSQYGREFEKTFSVIGPNNVRIRRDSKT